MYDIIIPSCKDFNHLSLHVTGIKSFDDIEYNYIPTGFTTSASVNRNYGLSRSLLTDNKYIIMIDDDIGGFYSGWQNDLVKPLIEDPSIVLSSARLMTPEGDLGPMMGVQFDIEKDYSIVDRAVLSAAIAFRKEDIKDKIDELHFCMDMIGSGYEDTLFCRILGWLYKDSKMVANNNCKLIHYHEMKSQQPYLQYNHKVYCDELKKRGLHE